MEKVPTTRTQTAFKISLIANFTATTLLCLIMLVYCLAAGLPLTALTIFPIALLMITFSYLAWQNGGSVWTLGQIIPGGIIWFYLPIKWLFFADLMIGIAVFVFGIVLFVKRNRADKAEFIKGQASSWKRTLTLGFPALVIALSMIICAFNVSANSFYVGDAIAKYSSPVHQGGEVVKHEYSSHIYDEDGIVLADNEKYCYVYLPYGYDETKQYNVMYLMHGGGASAESWIMESEGNTTKNMLDDMIANGTIEPLIVVCASFYYGNDQANGGSTSTFKYELRNDLMPSVEGKYSTYTGGDTSPASFIASRDHRGFGGFSMGSATTYQSALIGALDYFSYFAPMHGGFIDHDEVLNAITNGEYKEYEINYILCCEGTLDSTYPEHLALYRKLLDSGKVREGINGDMLTLLYRKHDIHAWQTELYNALVRFF